MQKIPKVSVIIPTMTGREELLNKLLKTIPKDCEVIVIPDMDILLAAKRNKGAKKAKGEYLLFIDDDNYLDGNAVLEVLSSIEKNNYGVVGLMACYDSNKNLIADGGSKRNALTGFTKGINTNAHWPSISKSPYEVDEVANAFLVHSELFYSLHGFDEKRFPIDLDEADLCKRIKNLGFKIVICPTALCFHKSQTYSAIPDFRRDLNAYMLPRNKLIYQRMYLNALSYWCHVIVFLPVHIFVYSASLLYRGKPGKLKPFFRGIWDGLRGRTENPYR